MLRPNPSIPSAGPALACALSLSLLSACGPKTEAPKPVEAPAGAPADTPAGKSVTVNQPISLTPDEARENLERLSSLKLAAPLKWDMADGVMIAPTTEDAKTGDKALHLTPTGGVGFHRVGFEGNYGGGAKTYHVTLWVKGAPGTGVKLEARGQTLLNSTRAADYATQYFDLAKGEPQANKLATEATNFKAPSITKDGDWNKISVDMTTRDGWLYFVIGMTTKGEHVFAGTSGIDMTLGGVTVTPAT